MWSFFASPTGAWAAVQGCTLPQVGTQRSGTLPAAQGVGPGPLAGGASNAAPRRGLPLRRALGLGAAASRPCRHGPPFLRRPPTEARLQAALPGRPVCRMREHAPADMHA